MVRPRTPFLISVVLGLLASALYKAAEAVYDATVQDLWKDTAAPFLREHVGVWSTAMLDWIGPFWSGVIAAFLLMFIIEMIFALRRHTSLLGAEAGDQALDLSKSFYEGQEIDLHQLLMQLSKNDMMIAVDKKYFKNCKFIGPSCMVIDGNSVFDGHLDLAIVGHPLEIKPRDAIVGAPVFSNCTFDGGHFHKVQLVVPQKSYLQIYRMLSEHIPHFSQRDPESTI